MKTIINIASCTSGNVLGIGVNRKIIESLNNNNRITNCNLLDSEMPLSENTKSKKKQKRIRMKKIRKEFKKKKIDFIICNIDTIKKYIKTFIKDSIYINKDMLYIYNIIDDEKKEEIIKKYKRYNTKIKELKDGNTKILQIDNKNSKTNLIKDYTYLIIDTLTNIFELISDVLVS